MATVIIGICETAPSRGEVTTQPPMQDKHRKDPDSVTTAKRDQNEQKYLKF